VKDGVLGAIGNTPLIRIKSLSDATGCEVHTGCHRSSCLLLWACHHTLCATHTCTYNQSNCDLMAVLLLLLLLLHCSCCHKSLCPSTAGPCTRRSMPPAARATSAVLLLHHCLHCQRHQMCEAEC
jgi:hypothetical protein